MRSDVEGEKQTEKRETERACARVATNYRRAQFYPASVEKGLYAASNSPPQQTDGGGRYPASVGVTTLLHSLTLPGNRDPSFRLLNTQLRQTVASPD